MKKKRIARRWNIFKFIKCGGKPVPYGTMGFAITSSNASYSFSDESGWGLRDFRNLGVRLKNW